MTTTYKFGLLITVGMLSFSSQSAIARDILTASEVYGLQREVNLHRHQAKKPKPVALGETMYPKDMVRTGADSWVKLLFNEGTLLRLDAHDVFRFLPNTRSFELRHGVILSMIYPGRGMTTHLTPEANVIAMGTALVIRHDAKQQETQVGVLTEKNGSPVYVTLPNGQGRVRLGAGDRVTVKQGVVSPVTSFNLAKFYQVCPLSEGLAPEEQAAIASEPERTQETWRVIRAETQEALEKQQAEAVISDDDGAALCEPVSAAPKPKKTKRPRLVRPSFNINIGGGGGRGPVVPGRP